MFVLFKYKFRTELLQSLLTLKERPFQETSRSPFVNESSSSKPLKFPEEACRNGREVVYGARKTLECTGNNRDSGLTVGRTLYTVTSVSRV